MNAAKMEAAMKLSQSTMLDGDRLEQLCKMVIQQTDPSYLFALGKTPEEVLALQKVAEQTGDVAYQLGMLVHKLNRGYPGSGLNVEVLTTGLSLFLKAIAGSCVTVDHQFVYRELLNQAAQWLDSVIVTQMMANAINPAPPPTTN